MTSRRLLFGTIAGLAALATAGGTSIIAQAAPVEAAPVEAAPVEAAPVEAAPVEAVPLAGAPIEMQSEQNPRGRVLRPRSRGAYRRDWRTRRGW